MLARVPAAQRPGYAVLMSVQSQFLDAVDGTATAKYDGMAGYVTNGLGLTPTDIADLRQKLVMDGQD